MTTTLQPEVHSAAAARPGVLAAVTAPLRTPRTLAELLHLVLDLPVGVAGVVVVVTGLSLSVGLLPLALVGLLVLVALLAVARGLGVVERARARALLGTRVEEPAPLPQVAGLLPAVRLRLVDPVAWRATAYLLLAFPVGVLTFVSATTALAVGLGFATYPLWAWTTLPDGGLTFGPGQTMDTAAEQALVCLVGLALVLPFAWLVRGLARLDDLLVRNLLGPTTLSASLADTELRRADSEQRRTAAVDGAAAERRRIERDLHDGAQVRLTSLAMDLGMAREALRDSGAPQHAVALVEEAHEHAKQALTEVRDLARGIHPAILTDRGLEPALASLASRCLVPVDLRVDVAVRPPAAVESTAYFLVAEALANVAKHSRAERALVRVERDGDVLRVLVEDDGRGGAVARPGGGLAGLVERARAAGGAVTVVSWDGGPTRISAELPCG